MPRYSYTCKSCGRRFVRAYKTYADYDAAVPTCIHCGSADVTQVIRRVAIQKRGPSFDLNALDAGDDSALDGLEDADPQTLGRYMREMGRELGEDLGGEFHEVVDRLERGESPEEIEADLPAMGGGGGLADDGGSDALPFATE